MKRYYSLIGNESPIENWVITYKDYPPSFPQVNEFNRMLTASHWPVLFYEQIPQRLLHTDPGFPILLRKEVDFSLPDWIFQPLLPWTKNLSRRYLIQTPNEKKPARILFSISHAININWQELCLKYPAQEHRWIWNSEEKDLPSNFPLPTEYKLGMGEVIHLKSFVPHRIVDLSFGISDTYTPLHLFAIHQGQDLQLFEAPVAKSLAKLKVISHSKWLIFE